MVWLYALTSCVPVPSARLSWFWACSQNAARIWATVGFAGPAVVPDGATRAAVAAVASLAMTRAPGLRLGGVVGAEVHVAALPLRVAESDDGVAAGLVESVAGDARGAGHRKPSCGRLPQHAGSATVAPDRPEVSKSASVVGFSSEWAVPGLNRGPSDFQSLALPTELTALVMQL